jgi:hypothetical protein
VELQPPPGSGLHAGNGALTGAEFGAILICMGALQVGLYVVLRGWPLAGVASRAVRLARSNFAVIVGGWLICLALERAVDLRP